MEKEIVSGWNIEGGFDVNLLRRNSLYDLLHRAHFRSQQYQLKQLSKAGLRVSDFHVLTQIVASPNVSQAEVVSILKIDKTILVRAMDRLETLGYAKRYPNSKDRRTHQLRASESGIKCVLIYKELFQRTQKISAEHLSQEEFEQLLSLLERVVLHP